MALPPREQRHRFLRCKGLQYTDADIEDFKLMLARIYRREVHRVQVFDFGGLPDLMAKGLSARMLMKHKDAQGIGISSPGDLLGTAPSYTMIRDYILRLYHRLIACSIAGRSQAPKKILEVVYYWEEEQAHISGGQFIARLAEHFRLLIAEILGGLTDIALELPVIDMVELRGSPMLDVHEIRRTFAEQHEVISAMARNFSRFCTWTTTSLARMMDRAGVTYPSYYETPREYTRRVRHKTDSAITFTPQKDP
ncbi:hypothetical protein Tco_0138071 [Tanacetum coccineum]